MPAHAQSYHSITVPHHPIPNQKNFLLQYFLLFTLGCLFSAIQILLLNLFYKNCMTKITQPKQYSRVVRAGKVSDMNTLVDS